MKSDDFILAIIIVCACSILTFVYWADLHFDNLKAVQDKQHIESVLSLELQKEQLAIKKQELRLQEIKQLAAFKDKNGKVYEYK